MMSRCDYIDVMGDLTREQAECVIMSAGASTEYVYRWSAGIGEDFEGGFDGDTYIPIYEFYPETVTNWGTAPVVKMMLGEDEESLYSGNLFYVDGFTASPILYDNTGTMIDNFEKVDPAYWPMDVGANGVCEFTLDDRNFIVYVAAQYTGYNEETQINKACQVYICEMGPALALEGMERYWMVPDELGDFSDGGTRVESMNVEYGVDGNGNPMVTLFIFKCCNGMAVYRITLDDGEEPGLTGDVNGDGNVNIGDINMVINMILAGNYSEVADVNGDGAVNIGDINTLIGIILK